MDLANLREIVLAVTWARGGLDGNYVHWVGGSLADILELREKYGVRVHADAAYGGYFWPGRKSWPRARRGFDLLHRVDSIVIDPHKHGLQPYGSGAWCFAIRASENFTSTNSPNPLPMFRFITPTCKHVKLPPSFFTSHQGPPQKIPPQLRHGQVQIPQSRRFKYLPRPPDASLTLMRPRATPQYPAPGETPVKNARPSQPLAAIDAPPSGNPPNRARFPAFTSAIISASPKRRRRSTRAQHSRLILPKVAFPSS